MAKNLMKVGLASGLENIPGLLATWSPQSGTVPLDGSVKLPDLETKRTARDAIDGAIQTILQRPSAWDQEKPKADLSLRLFDAAANFKQIYSNVSMHMDRSWKDGLFKQIDSLLDIEEWEEEDLPPSARASLSFLRLLLVLRPERRPGIAISNVGTLVAGWQIENNRLTIECRTDGLYRWVLSRDIDGTMERAAGTSPLARLPEVLLPYRPTVWFKYAK